jgi:calcium-dependent protein kinase
MQPSRELIQTAEDIKIHRSSFVFPINNKLTDRYNISQNPIYTNDSAKIYSAGHSSFQDKNDRMFVVFKEPVKENSIQIWKRMDHPYIVKPYEYFTGDRFGLITEKHEGPLAKFLESHGQFSEKDGAQVCRKLLLALNFLHKNRIMHRRISLENIVYTNSELGIVKLSNFTKATFFTPDLQLTDNIPLNADYTAPEVLKGAYDEKCDVWSCGVVLYTLLGGKLPYEDRSDEEILKNIANAKYNFEKEEWKGVSDDATIFIRRMLECDVGKRYSAREALNDPWLLKHTQKKLDKEGEETLRNLETFSPKGRLNKFFLFYMTDQLLPSKEREVLSETFDAMDLDHDGKITRDDLATRIKSEDYKKILENVDIDKSGDMSYSEFIMGALGSKPDFIRDTSKAAFALLDSNHDGFIDYSDLKSCFSYESESREILDHVWEELISEANTSSNGKIGLEEFVRLVNQ